MDYQVDLTIDAKGKKCPMPVLLTSKGIKQIEPGQIMVVEATDSGSEATSPRGPRTPATSCWRATSEDGFFRYVIRKG